MKSIINIGETCDLIDKALVAIDITGKIKYVNNTFIRLFAIHENRVLGQNYTDAITLMDRTGLQKLKLFDSNMMAVKECEGVLLVNGRVEHYIQCKAKCHFNESQQQQYWLFIFENITEEIELKQQLKHKRKLEVLGELALGVAHDLNNILGGIIGCTEIITMEHSENKRLYKFTKSILHSANNASILSRKLIRFSAPVNPVFEMLDINYVLKDAIEIVKHSLDKKISIRTDFSETNIIINADRAEIEVAFFNLAINAQDAMPHGGEIFISTETVSSKNIDNNEINFDIAQYLKIVIKDTGEGIPASIIGKVFDSDFTTKNINFGDGLGLSTVKDIVQDHSGVICVNSSLGVGTEFIIYIPVAESNKLITSVENENTAEQENEIITSSGTEANKKLVLLVDDNDIIRLAISEILKVLGYEVLQADNGEDGVKILRENNDRIDFVLLDMVMPVMDGRDTLIAMRSINSDIDIIIQSGYIKQVVIDELLDLGASGFLLKPFKINEIKAVLDKRIQRNSRNNSGVLNAIIREDISHEEVTAVAEKDIIALMLVEKDENSREIIQEVLYHSGFAVVAYENIEQAEAALKENKYFPLYFLDIDLNNEKDIEFISTVNNQNTDLPHYIIVSSEKEKENSAVKVLELGANDFLPKPFSLNFLKVRLEVARKHFCKDQVRFETQALLKENEERMSLAIEGVNIGMWDWKIDEKEFYASDKCKEIFGYNNLYNDSVLEYLIGVTFKEDQSKLSMELNKYLCRPEGNLNVEFRIKHPEQGDRWISAIAKMFDQKSVTKQKRLIGISMDITKRKTMELVLRQESQKLEEMVVQRTNELLKSNEELSREIEAREIAEKKNQEHQLKLMDADKLASLGIIVSGIGHEINNPIQFIMLNLPFIQSAWEAAIPILDEYYKNNADFTLRGIPYSLARKRLPNMASDIMEGAERISNIVKELREYSRQRQSEDFVETDIVEVVLTAKSLLSKFMGNKSNVISLHIPDEKVIININPTRIEQVLINLMQNAILALKESIKKQIDVTVKYTVDRQGVEIAVSDTGCGISEDDLKHLTDPFFTTREEYGGTGLGLAICNRIIHNHSGELHFSSKVGEGTTVTIILPFKKNSKSK